MKTAETASYESVDMQTSGSNSFQTVVLTDDNETDISTPQAAVDADSNPAEYEILSPVQRYLLILKLAIPTMISNLSLRMQDTLNLMFLGHLGDKNLVAGVGLGGCFCNITGMISIYGMNMAMDTLIS